VFEKILFEVVECERMKVFVFEFENSLCFTLTKYREPDVKIRAVYIVNDVDTMKSSSYVFY